jgi:hypothetical protein
VTNSISHMEIMETVKIGLCVKLKTLYFLCCGLEELTRKTTAFKSVLGSFYRFFMKLEACVIMYKFHSFQSILRVTLLKDLNELTYFESCHKFL